MFGRLIGEAARGTETRGGLGEFNSRQRQCRTCMACNARLKEVSSRAQWEMWLEGVMDKEWTEGESRRLREALWVELASSGGQQSGIMGFVGEGD